MRRKVLLLVLVLVGLALAGVIYAQFNAPTVDDVSSELEILETASGEAEMVPAMGTNQSESEIGDDKTTAESLAAIPAETNQTQEAEIEKIDSDGDGMSDWFEENYTHTNPKVANDRYIIILDTSTVSAIPYFTEKTRQDFLNLENFLVNQQKFKSENVFILIDKDATYSNFRETIDYIVSVSDKNDFVYIMIGGHGSDRRFQFHTGREAPQYQGNFTPGYGFGDKIHGYTDKPPEELIEISEQISKTQQGEKIFWEELNELVSKIKYKRMLLTVNSCGGNRIIQRLEGRNRVVIVPLSSKYLIYTIKNSNNCLSVKELFESSVSFQHQVNPNPDEKWKRKIADSYQIANDFYFGEAKVKDLYSAS